MSPPIAAKKVAAPKPGAIGYHPLAIGLHWAVAALMATAFWIALCFDDGADGPGPALLNLHALCGLAVLALSLARLAWRLGHPPPPGLGGPMARAARWVHAALYGLTLLVPALGLAALSLGGGGINFGLAVLPALVAKRPAWSETVGDIHQALAYGLVALAALHVAAALYHHFIRRDGVLALMAPWLRKGKA